MGRSEILSPLESDVNSRFCSVLSDGGSEILGPSQSVKIAGFVQFLGMGDQKF